LEKALNHKHFEDIKSTQDYLVEHQVELGSDVLISCENQLSGHGQYERRWDSYQGSLCISFTLSPNEVITLSSLEVGCLITKYISTRYEVDLKLKWPNDVLANDALTGEAKKVGGILLNNSSSNKQLVVGVGLNFFPLTSTDQYRTPAGSILPKEISFSKENEAKGIYHFIQSNRMGPNEVVKFWNEKCIHLNKKITFIDAEKEIKGEFIGIGRNGEALIHHMGTTASYFSGSIIL